MSRLAAVAWLVWASACAATPLDGLPVLGLPALGGAPESPRGAEATCAKACATRASMCTPKECARGCNLVLDRLLEHEGDHVIDCMAAGPAPCDDHSWARCATRIGPYADGGPPPPPPPSEGLDEGE